MDHLWETKNFLEIRKRIKNMRSFRIAAKIASLGHLNQVWSNWNLMLLLKSNCPWILLNWFNKINLLLEMAMEIQPLTLKLMIRLRCRFKHQLLTWLIISKVIKIESFVLLSSKRKSIGCCRLTLYRKVWKKIQKLAKWTIWWE